MQKTKMNRGEGIIERPTAISSHTIKSGLRHDGRTLHGLRTIFMKTGTIGQASGSCFIEMGSTKVICSVFGPREANTRSQYSEKGRLICDYKYAPFSLHKWKDQRQSAEERDASRMVEQALSPSVMLDKFPKAVIDINIIVLEADGSELAASITAASLALADAGVELYDIVPCVSVGKVDGFLVADTTRTEEDSDGAVLTLACMPSTQEVTLLSEQGDLTQDGAGEPEQALQLAINGCVNIANLMRDSLVKSIAK